MIKKFIMAAIPNLPPAQINMMCMPYYVGQFIMSWAKHERQIADMLSNIRGCDYEVFRDQLLDGQLAQYEIEIRKTLHAVGAHHPSSPYLNEILHAHGPLRDLRNEIVHGFWTGIGPSDEYILKRKPRRGKDTPRSFTLNEIEAAWKKLEALSNTVVNAGRVAHGKPPI